MNRFSRLSVLALGSSLSFSLSLPILVASSLAFTPSAHASSDPSNSSPRLSRDQSRTLMARRRLRWRVRARASRYRVGGFSRSSTCPAQNGTSAMIEAVVPPSRSSEGIPVANAPVNLTMSAHPTFFVRVPSLPGATLQLTVQTGDTVNGEYQQLYSTTVELGKKAGVVGIEMPGSAPKLQVGQNYLWRAALICEDPETLEDTMTVVGGWIQRVSKQTLPRERAAQAAFFADRSIWHDAVAMLARDRYQFPSPLEAENNWAELMQAANLTNLARTPIVQMHTPRL